MFRVSNFPKLSFFSINFIAQGWEAKKKEHSLRFKWTTQHCFFKRSAVPMLRAKYAMGKYECSIQYVVVRSNKPLGSQLKSRQCRYIHTHHAEHTNKQKRQKWRKWVKAALKVVRLSSEGGRNIAHRVWNGIDYVGTGILLMENVRRWCIHIIVVEGR